MADQHDQPPVSRSNQRHQAFSSKKFEPFVDHPDLELKHSHVTGPSRLFNPTHARYNYNPTDLQSSSSHHLQNDGDKNGNAQQYAKKVEYKWRSRDNRKGRHTLLIDPAKDDGTAKFKVPPVTTSIRSVLKGIWRMFTYFPVWDVSYLVAQCFTWGSLIFVANGLFFFLPLVAPDATFKDEGKTAGGVTAFVGTVFFQFGVVLLFFEAINTNRSGCFGFALEEVFSKDSGERNMVVKASKDHCVHHHPNKKSLYGHNVSKRAVKKDAESSPGEQMSQTKEEEGKSWIWFPSWKDLKTHYIHEMGFISALIYLVAGTIFWIIGFTSLPNVEQSLSTGLFYGVFWTPDLLGSIGFVIGSYLIMLETQPNWYTPSIGTLGWHIGLWNTIGSVGFALSAIFGIIDQAKPASWLLYQSDLSTTWGSAAFLIASVIQWYESLDKNVVETLPKSK